MIDIVWVWATFVEDDDGKMFLFETKNLVVKELPILNEKRKKEQQAESLDKQTWNYMIN